MQPHQHQEQLESYLLEHSVLDSEQLAIAKKMQARQDGPLLMILLQLSFIDLKQLGGLLDCAAQFRADYM
ncbi:MAG: DUF2949 domain-containing protein [Oscillatoriales cyanobacterium SM2_2_1]|nr:DUF2949 domain-containing protein [Oscillatoriales cyanobacterium SM2_2_1]